MATEGGADYRLVWPRDLFKSEAAYLLNKQTEPGGWNMRCEWLLEDAFAGGAPRDDFLAQTNSGGFIDQRKRFLINLLRRADSLQEASGRVPYWSQRRGGPGPGQLPLDAVTRDFVRLVNELEAKGYFDKAFGLDCVDAPRDIDPAQLLELELGVANLWPLHADQLASDVNVFFDVVEALHDMVARPRSRHLHSYAGCGWHHEEFSLNAGGTLYRWRVNRLLERSSLGVELADAGEDLGRLVASTDEARDDLVESMLQREDEGTGDRVRHAIALFRRRDATEHDKRSAVVALHLVLEERRDLLKERLVKKDEGALFRIANEFAIRHQDKQQQGDYDAAFLDWMFWWYLATIELTDRLLSRSAL